MTNLAELFDPDLLAHCISERLVVARRHPHRDLTILNYTERCQYERGLWNPVTLACRGLIHDSTTGEIIARPFRKFFNYGQSEAGTIDLDAPCAATDKLDGSLGILYGAGGEWSIATRGSFDSEQARHGTALLRSIYSDYAPPPRWTVLFEIVYPENRIVIDYAGVDDLILLGAVEIATGKSVGPRNDLLADWPGRRADVFHYSTVAAALAAPPRPNAEGLVLHLLDTDDRVKIKQEDYVALHRIVTGLNERMVWEHVRNGGTAAELCANLPDEFHWWVDEVAARLLATADAIAAGVETAYSAILATLPAEPTRKDFALAAKTHEHASLLFLRHDGKDVRARIWPMIEPSGRVGPRAVPDEAVA